MASRPVPTKTPNRTARPTRHSTAGRAGHLGDADTATTTASRGAPTPVGAVDQEWSTPPSTSRQTTSRNAVHNSTLLFRALLLVAAAAALAFTVAAWIAPPNSGADNSTLPDAPPPAVFVQPDG
ncbi:MAG: hypothetical protein OES24_07465 [Acidimicrobiia bacterium]|nr:hypothetical protein [Acidimicrobiia bacterium]